MRTISSSDKDVKELANSLNIELRELRKQRLKYENRNQELKKSITNISHDIRTPLTSIVGASSLLLDNEKELSPEQKNEFIEDIRSEAQWLIRIVENLLSITRIGDGSDSARLDKVEEMIEEIIGSAVLKFKKRLI